MQEISRGWTRWYQFFWAFPCYPC